MFARYPNRRLRLKDVLRVRLQRALLMLPVILALELSGTTPALREFVRVQGPLVAARLDAHSDRPAPVARAGCAPVLRGQGIVFQRSGDC